MARTKPIQGMISPARLNKDFMKLLLEELPYDDVKEEYQSVAMVIPNGIQVITQAQPSSKPAVQRRILSNAVVGVYKKLNEKQGMKLSRGFFIDIPAVVDAFWAAGRALTANGLSKFRSEQLLQSNPMVGTDDSERIEQFVQVIIENWRETRKARREASETEESKVAGESVVPQEMWHMFLRELFQDLRPLVRNSTRLASDEASLLLSAIEKVQLTLMAQSLKNMLVELVQQFFIVYVRFCRGRIQASLLESWAKQVNDIVGEAQKATLEIIDRARDFTKSSLMAADQAIAGCCLMSRKKFKRLRDNIANQRGLSISLEMDRKSRGLYE